MERSDHGQDIVAETCSAVVRRYKLGLAGRPESATGDSVHVVLRREFRSELVEDMSGIAHTREQHERPSCTAPIEYFELDIAFDRDHLSSVRRGIGLRRILRIHQADTC